MKKQLKHKIAKIFSGVAKGGTSLKLVITAKELANIAIEKEKVRLELIVTAKELAEAAVEKENKRVKLVKLARHLNFIIQEKKKAKIKLVITAKELEKVVVEKEEISQKVTETEKKYSGLFINSAVGVSLVGLDGRWREVNDSLCEITGYSRKELLSDNFLDITFKDDKEKSRKTLKLMASGKKDRVVLEKRYVKKSGQIIWVNLNISVARDSNHKPEYFIVITEDITDRKKIEQEFKKSNEFVENARAIMLRIAPNRKITFINNFGAKIFGYKRKELIDKDIGIILPKVESTGRDLDALIEKILVKPERYYFNQNENIKKDGSRLWVNWTNKATRDNNGKLLEIFTIGIDVTEKREAERRLIESENIFRNIFESAVVGVALVGLDFKFIKVNEYLAKIWGYSKSELVNMRFTDLTHPLEIARDKNNVRKLIQGEIDYYKIEKRYVRKDGQIIWADTSVYLITDSDNKPVNLVAIVDDISERKELDEAKTNFLSIASHQLRTPLSMTKWVLESLIRQGSLNPKQEQKLNELVYSNERLIRLVNDLLRVSTIDTGKLIVKKQYIGLNDVVSRLLFSIKNIIKEKNKEISFIGVSKIKKIYCDPILLFEVLENLLVNAISYSPKSTKVITVSIKERKNDYIISVNNGGVMSQKSLERVRQFNKFTRGHNAAEAQPTGSGLGLYITKKLIEVCNGKIWLESNVKNGTTFYFTINKKNG